MDEFNFKLAQYCIELTKFLGNFKMDEITRMISAQIALHSVQLPLLISGNAE